MAYWRNNEPPETMPGIQPEVTGIDEIKRIRQARAAMPPVSPALVSTFDLQQEMAPPSQVPGIAEQMAPLRQGVTQQMPPQTGPVEPPPAFASPIPESVRRDAEVAGFLAQLSNFGRALDYQGRQRGVLPDPMAAMKAEQAVRSQYMGERLGGLREQQAIQALQMAGRPKPMTPLQQLQVEEKTRDLQRTGDENDPNSEISKRARAEVQMLYPEFAGSVSKEDLGKLTYASIKTPLFEKKIDDFYAGEQAQEKSDIQLERQKAFADYTKQLELQKAALRGGKVEEARRIAGEQRVQRGGYESQLDAITESLKARFPEGYLERYPQINKAVNSIAEATFKRGSMNRQLTVELSKLTDRAEKDEAYNIPGWDRATGAGTPELAPKEIQKAREAVSSWNTVRKHVRRLIELRDKNVGIGDFIASQANYETEDMAEALQIQEDLLAAVRKVNEYGAPQGFEIIRLERITPRFDTWHGFINGVNRLAGLRKTMSVKMGELMQANGWEPAGRQKVRAKNFKILEIEDE